MLTLSWCTTDCKRWTMVMRGLEEAILSIRDGIRMKRMITVK